MCRETDAFKKNVYSHFYSSTSIGDCVHFHWKLHLDSLKFRVSKKCQIFFFALQFLKFYCNRRSLVRFGFTLHLDRAAPSPEVPIVSSIINSYISIRTNLVYRRTQKICVPLICTPTFIVPLASVVSRRARCYPSPRSGSPTHDEGTLADRFAANKIYTLLRMWIKIVEFLKGALGSQAEGGTRAGGMQRDAWSDV